MHGGVVAAMFDEVLGMTQSLSGQPGMTGTLRIRYRRPTPLHRELRFEGTLDRVDGRKIFTTARCLDGDDVPPKPRASSSTSTSNGSSTWSRPATAPRTDRSHRSPIQPTALSVEIGSLTLRLDRRPNVG